MSNLRAVWFWSALVAVMILLGLPSAGAVRAESPEEAAQATAAGRIFIISSAVQHTPESGSSRPSISFTLETSDGYRTIVLAADAEVTDADGNPIAPNTLPPNDVVRVTGLWETATRLLATRVERENR